MNAETTWLADEPCPACGASLLLTDNGTPAIVQDCPACGWTVTGDLAGQAGARR
jgi:hypothetical protein